ncbi:unnamed protein product [Arctogadus glacialis]
MHRILQRRRMRKLRVVWVSLALMALSLAACSAVFTAWTWRQTRDLSQSFKILQDRLEQSQSSWYTHQYTSTTTHLLEAVLQNLEGLGQVPRLAAKSRP